MWPFLFFLDFRQTLEFWKFQYFLYQLLVTLIKIKVFYLDIPSELIGIRKFLENDSFWSVLNWEILEHEPFWLSFELRNTGTGTRLTQFWTEKYWNRNHFDSVLNWEILEHEPVWLSSELRNTGTGTSLNLYFGCLNLYFECLNLSLIHIWRCRRYSLCRSRWSPYH